MSGKKKLTPIDLDLEVRVIRGWDFVREKRISFLDLLPLEGVHSEHLPMEYFTNAEVREAYDLAQPQEAYKPK